MGLGLYAPPLEPRLPIPAEVQVGDAGGDQQDREEYDHEEGLSQREPPRASVEDGLAHNWNRALAAGRVNVTKAVAVGS